MGGFEVIYDPDINLFVTSGLKIRTEKRSKLRLTGILRCAL